MPYRDPEKMRAHKRSHHTAHREEDNARFREYGLAHRKEVLARHKVYYAARPDEYRARHLKRLYGLSIEAFESMLAGQGGRCAACGTSSWKGRGPHIDHDHRTGTVRGILCPNCNVAAGMLDDEPERARLLMIYLQRKAEQ